MITVVLSLAGAFVFSQPIDQMVPDRDISGSLGATRNQLSDKCLRQYGLCCIGCVDPLNSEIHDNSDIRVTYQNIPEFKQAVYGPEYDDRSLGDYADQLKAQSQKSEENLSSQNSLTENAAPLFLDRQTSN